MDGTAFVGRGARIDRRRQQRVREADVAGSDLDDACPFGRREGIGCSQIQPRCRRDQVRRRLGRRRHDQEGQGRTGEEGRRSVRGAAPRGPGGREGWIPDSSSRARAALAISSAKKGLPSAFSWMRRRRGRGHERPRRARSIAWSAPRLSGPRVMRCSRSGGSARSRSRATCPPPADRSASTSPTGSSRRRRMANSSAEAVGRSSH